MGYYVGYLVGIIVFNTLLYSAFDKYGRNSLNLKLIDTLILVKRNTHFDIPVFDLIVVLDMSSSTIFSMASPNFDHDIRKKNDFRFQKTNRLR